MAAAAALPWLAGCGRLADQPEPQPSPFGPGGIPPQLRGRAAEEQAAGAVPGATAGELPAAAAASADTGALAGAITPEEEIVWTDPDDPEGGIPELESLLATPDRGPWEVSETVARRRAVREGRCLLAWFTDSRRSAPCKVLDRELLGLPEFEEWAGANLVRLRVDQNVEAALQQRQFADTFEEMDTESRMKDYVEELRKRFRVLGNPTLLVLSPHGEVIGRYRGFRAGGGEFLWGQLRSAVIAGDKSYQKWRGGLERRGYREWSDRQGRTVLARLLACRDGQVLLVEPDGQRARTREDRLSDADRRWLEEQRQRRR